MIPQEYILIVFHKWVVHIFTVLSRSFRSTVQRSCREAVAKQHARRFDSVENLDAKPRIAEL